MQFAQKRILKPAVAIGTVLALCFGTVPDEAKGIFSGFSIDASAETSSTTVIDVGSDFTIYEWETEAAIEWALSNVGNSIVQGAYDSNKNICTFESRYNCTQFIRSAYWNRTETSYIPTADASVWWDSWGYSTNTTEVPPRGALVFYTGYVAALGRDTGHIGLSLGDGTAVMAGGTTVEVMDIWEYDRTYTNMTYVGWGTYKKLNLEVSTSSSSSPSTSVVDTGSIFTIYRWETENAIEWALGNIGCSVINGIDQDHVNFQFESKYNCSLYIRCCYWDRTEISYIPTADPTVWWEDWKHSTNTTEVPPRGALVFYTGYVAALGRDTGHIGLSLGDGTAVMAGGDTVEICNIWKYDEQMTNMKYVGWGTYRGYNLEIPAQGHTHSYSTAWSSDNTNHWHECACGATSDKSAHTYGSWTTTKAATCTADGTKSRSCSVCGAKQTGIVAKLGHNYSSTYTVDKAATCTADGTKSRSCSVCGAKETGTVAKLGHNYSSTYTVDKAATCTSTGTKSRHCTRCSATTDSTTIKATGHTYGNWTTTKAATCTADGTKSRSCSVCGTKKTAIIDKTGHKASDWIIDKAATATTKGSKHKECTVCGYIIETAEIGTTATIPTREEQISAFVERLYTIMLNRSSDAGKQSHINGLLSGKTAAEIAEGFVLGEELKVLNISNEEFVRRMYLTFLDREADHEGLAIWTAVLDKGCSYGRMFRDFCNSAEFKIVCDSYGIRQGSYEVTEYRDINENITHYCSRMYTKALGRAYDVDGLNNWAKALVNGTETPESLAMIFLNGAEFQMWNHSDEVFVDRLYETLFNRPADAEGKQTWLNLLALGTSRKTAIETFVQSEEFKILKASLGL